LKVRVTKYFLIATLNLALPAAVIACCGSIVGMSKRWRRNRSGVRVGAEQKVSPTLDIFRHSPDQWKDRFYSLQVAVSIVAEKRQSGAEYHELEFL
jgi:hypothetical protein